MHNAPYRDPSSYFSVGAGSMQGVDYIEPNADCNGRQRSISTSNGRIKEENVPRITNDPPLNM